MKQLPPSSKCVEKFCKSRSTGLRSRLSPSQNLPLRKYNQTQPHPNKLGSIFTQLHPNTLGLISTQEIQRTRPKFQSVLPRFCTQQPGPKQHRASWSSPDPALDFVHIHTETKNHSKQQLQFQISILVFRTSILRLHKLQCASILEFYVSSITHSKVIYSRHHPRQLNINS